MKKCKGIFEFEVEEEEKKKKKKKIRRKNTAKLAAYASEPLDLLPRHRKRQFFDTTNVSSQN